MTPLRLRVDCDSRTVPTTTAAHADESRQSPCRARTHPINTRTDALTAATAVTTTAAAACSHLSKSGRSRAPTTNCQTINQSRLLDKVLAPVVGVRHLQVAADVLRVEVGHVGVVALDARVVTAGHRGMHAAVVLRG